MSEEVRTKPPSDADAKVEKPPLPKLAADSTWTHTIGDETVRFREPTFDERSAAEEVGAKVAPNQPISQFLGLSNEQAAQLLGMTVERRNRKGGWEPLTRQLIGKRGDSFFFALLGYYLVYRQSLAEQTRNLFQPFSEEPSTTQESAESTPK